MDRSASCYLNGVPVKISEKYRPPRRTTLPAGLSHFDPPSYLFCENIESTLESSVLETITLMRNRKKELVQQRNERILADESRKAEEKEKEEVKQETIPSVPNEKICIPTTTAGSTFSHSQSGMTVLTPILSSNVGETKKESRSTINLSEFESYSTNPFEEMELKTLNDKEELAMLLQPNYPSNYRQPYSQNNMAWGAAQETYQPVTHFPPNWVPVQGTVNNSQLIEQAVGKLDLNRSPAPVSMFSEPMRHSHGPLRQAKSVPDLSESSVSTGGDLKQASGTSEKRLNSKTPPPRMPFESLKMVPSIRTTPRMFSQQLSPEIHQLVIRMCGMGFPEERCINAAKRVGANEKNLVDQLLLIQKYEELGFSEPLIESALNHVKDHKHDSLQRHMELSKILTALGFDIEKVSMALISSNYDRDRALDILLLM